jgi:hypothetical protein
MTFITDKPKLRTPKTEGRPLTKLEQLENIDWFMVHCNKCQEWTGWAKDVCPHCGYHNISD